MRATARSAPAEAATEIAMRAITVEQAPIRRGLFRRRGNRRIGIAGPTVLPWLLRGLGAAARKLAVLGKALAVVVLVAGAALGGRQVVRHVVASPRFAVREIRVGPSTRVSADELQALTGVRLGDRLLAVDPDAVAARLTAHPWIASARVRRDLPATLSVEVTERRAAASALLGALYLLDDAGHPFKRASVEEADGLPVLTGVTRDQYAAMRTTSEAVFRQQLALLSAYATPGAAGLERPKLSEIHADPRDGFSVVLLDGGGQIRLGHGDFGPKLDALDQILGALGPRGAASLAVVYLDGPVTDRVTLQLGPAPAPTTPRAAPPPVVASKKFRMAEKRGED